MINRYTDHAANERTLLAWVRTAIAVMAFGFLVEKFDLFLQVAARSAAARTPSAAGSLVGNLTGMLLIVLGGAMMAVAALRFRRVERDIDADEVRAIGGGPMALALVVLLLALAGTLVGYLLYTVVRGPA